MGNPLAGKGLKFCLKVVPYLKRMNASDKKSGAALQFFGHRSFNRERNPTTVQCALLSIRILKLVHINCVYN